MSNNMTTEMLLVRAVMLLAMTVRWLRLHPYGIPLAEDIEKFILEVQDVKVTQ